MPAKHLLNILWFMVDIRDYVERDSSILNLCEGKRVLHLGCVGFTDSPVDDKVRLARKSLHQKITDRCDCVGIDLDQHCITQLQERGIFGNVIEGNVEELDRISRDIGQFDLVVAGDIIEHLSNPGRMLEGIKPFLRENACVVISTPNSFGLPGFVRYLTGSFREGAQHVLCFNPHTLEQLLVRHGYRVEKAQCCYQLFAQKTYRFFALGKNLITLFPRFGGTLLYVCRLQ